MKDIDDIRRDNLRLIEAECGSPSAAASLLQMSPAQFSNLRDGAKDSKTGKPRGMRKTTAREIEVNASKPVGWLDANHSGADSVPKFSSENAPAGWERLNAEQRNAIQTLIDTMLAGIIQPSNAQPAASTKGDQPSDLPDLAEKNFIPAHPHERKKGRAA